jgi:hypothetical protein
MFDFDCFQPEPEPISKLKTVLIFSMFIIGLSGVFLIAALLYHG